MLNIKNVVTDVIKRNPKDCVFIADAINVITNRFYEKLSDDAPDSDIADLLVTLIKEAELYCPHEGINRMPLC